MFQFNHNPFVRELQMEGVTIQISDDLSSVAFTKRSPYACLDMNGKHTGYWIDNKLMIDGIAYPYNRWYTLSTNTVLKEYLAHLLGYVSDETTKGETE